jgi:hypothetical protein
MSGVNLPVRANHDNGFNNYGTKLLSLCKENNLCILNGRKEDGKCTYNAMYRNRPVSSLVDYVISNLDCYENISNMCVLDLTEFSDHCPLTFSLDGCIHVQPSDNLVFDKIVWNSSENDLFDNLVREKCNTFNEIVTNLSEGVYNIDECMKCFSDTVYDISFSCHGKTYSNRPKKKKRKSLWFNDECRNDKKIFMMRRDVLPLLNRKKTN